MFLRLLGDSLFGLLCSGHGLVLGLCSFFAHIADKAIQRAFCFFRVHALTGLQIDQVHAHDHHLCNQCTHDAEHHAQARHHAHGGAAIHHAGQGAHAAAVATTVTTAIGAHASHGHAQHGIGAAGNADAHGCQGNSRRHQASKQHHADQCEDDVEHDFHQHHFYQALAGDQQHIGNSGLDGQAAPQRRCHQWPDDPDHHHQHSCCHQHQHRVGNKGNDAADERNLADEINDRSHNAVGQCGQEHDQGDQQELGQAQQTRRSGRCEGAHGLILGLVHQHDADGGGAGHQHDNGEQHEDQHQEGGGMHGQPLTHANDQPGGQQGQKSHKQGAPLRQPLGSTR